MISVHLLRRFPSCGRKFLLQERRRRFSFRAVSRLDGDSAGEHRRLDLVIQQKSNPIVNSVDEFQFTETKLGVLSPIELKGVVVHEIQPVTVILKQSAICSPTQTLVSDATPSTSNDGSSTDKFASQDITQQSPKEPAERFPEGRPNWTHLEHVKIRLTETLPLFFKRQMDLTFYDKDVVVENRLNNTVWKGLQTAAVNIALYRGLAYFRYIQVEMMILSITPIIEDGTIRVRWRVLGVGILRYLNALIQRSKFASFEESVRANAKWIDGTAIFKLAGDGLVYHVTIDRVMPDNEVSMGKAKTVKEKLAAKVGAAVS